MNTPATAHAAIEGIIVEKQGEEAENNDGSGGGHASIQVLRVGGPPLFREGDQNRTKPVENFMDFTIKSVENDYTAENVQPEKLKDAGKEGDDPVRLGDAVKENQLKDAVEKNPVKLRDAAEDVNNPVKLRDAAEDVNNPIRLRDAVMENQLKDAGNNTEGGHALKSQPPGVQGGALHGATDAGGEASQEKLTSFEVLLDVGGGHALLGARPEDVGHQGVSLPHHTDGGHVPTDDERAEEQPARMYAYKNAAVELYYAESARVENKKTYRNTELPRHSALMPSRCPEDSMGGDIVEGPVVFFPTRYGSSSEVPASQR